MKSKTLRNIFLNSSIFVPSNYQILFMKYIISYTQPHTHFIDIEFIIENNRENILHVQLPAWRPGRYELGNFAKNVQRWAAYDDKGNALHFHKITKDCWEINTAGNSIIHIRYNYYAAQLDAGSCWLDEKQLYVNPVHCFLFVSERRNEPCEVELKIPETYKVATSLKLFSGKKSILLQSQNYDELVDSPFIASDSLKHNSFSVENVRFNIWFQGECKPDWERIIADFKKFIAEQIRMMKDFPSKEYHFLFQMLPYKFHHGVEHCNSTVIALGPSYDLMKDILYEDFLGISSHELFHSWNIKKIRPVEMFPYDYTKENYSRLGYVAEGVTTYYGDLFLYRAGISSDYTYFKILHQRLQKHFDNYGRFNLSVADSSFDTWLDGYTDGIPNRKTNIYTEGCLCALMVDLLIRKQTKNKKSLDDVMQILYNDFAKKGMGYSEKDYQQVVESVADSSFADFFEKYYNGTENYESMLNEVLEYVGMEIIKSRSRMYFENRFGFKIIYTSCGSAKVTIVAPHSIADRAKISINDEILAINRIPLQNNLKEWCKYFAEESVKLTIRSNHQIYEVQLLPNDERYFQIHYVNKKADATTQQKKNFEEWTKKKF